MHMHCYKCRYLPQFKVSLNFPRYSKIKIIGSVMACHNMKLNFTVRYHKETTKNENLSIIRLSIFSLSFISNSISKCHLSNLMPIFVHFDLFNTCVYVSGFFLTRGGGNCYQIGKYKNEFRLDPWPVLLNETVKNTFESCE